MADICADNYSDVVVGSLIINKLPLSTYIDLEKSGQLSTRTNQLFFIDDPDEFDVKNLRVSNVGTPLSDNDAITKNYADNTYISPSNLSLALRDQYVSDTRIYDQTHHYCLSADGKYYELQTTSDSDWEIIVQSGPYTANQITVDYVTESRVAGWRFKTPDPSEENWLFTNNTDRTALRISQSKNINDEQISLIGYRNTWKKCGDQLIRSSMIESKLSDITTATSTEDVIRILSGLYTAIKS